MSATQMKSLEKEVAAPTSEPASGGDSASRRLLVLLHGQKADDDQLREAIARLRKEGHQITVRVTYEGGDVDRLVKEALTLKTVDTLVAAGGDGTICEVVDALLKHTGGLSDTRSVNEATDPVVQAHGDPPTLDAVSVAILPMGTSNDFSATTGLPADPYEALLLATQRSSMRRIDVGLLNGKVFMNTATIGASADAGKHTSSNLKKILGPFAFLFTGVQSMHRWQPVTSVLCFPNIKEHDAEQRSQQQEKLERDAKEGIPLANKLERTSQAESAQTVDPKDASAGQKSNEAGGSVKTSSSFARAAAERTGGSVGELEGVPLLHLTAANNRQVASMVAISPDAVLDDGMLDVIYLTGGMGHQVRRMLGDLLTKGPGGTKAVSTLLRVPWLEVITEKPLDWSLDGDPMPEATNNFRFSLIHRAVQCHLPDDRMLVAGQPDHSPEGAGVSASGVSASGKKHHKHRLGNPLRLPRGRLHPPSLSAMIGSVVRFRKKKNWGAVLRSGLSSTIHFLLVASVGGLAVRQYYVRKERKKTVLEVEEVKEISKKGSKEDKKARELERKDSHQRRKNERKLQKAAAGQGF